VFGSSAVLVLVTGLLFPQDHLSPKLQDAILQGKEEVRAATAPSLAPLVAELLY
jgi:hypothetical protein